MKNENGVKVEIIGMKELTGIKKKNRPKRAWSISKRATKKKIEKIRMEELEGHKRIVITTKDDCKFVESVTLIGCYLPDPTHEGNDKVEGVWKREGDNHMRRSR